MDQLSTTADFAGIDGVFIDLGPTSHRALPSDFLSAAELSNLSSYLAGGGRVVAMGDHVGFDDWNDSILSLVGATSGGTIGGYTLTVLDHELTHSVDRVFTQSAGSFSTTIGQYLFDIPFAALWNGNYLTLLDSNVFDAVGFFGATDHDNIQFRNNVVGWLGGDATIIPEPGTELLLAAGLVVLGRVRRRR